MDNKENPQPWVGQEPQFSLYLRNADAMRNINWELARWAYAVSRNPEEKPQASMDWQLYNFYAAENIEGEYLLSAWPAANVTKHSEVASHVQEYYQSSGWSDLIAPVVRELFIPSKFGTMPLLSPAFYRGKRYQLISGSSNSAGNIKLMRLKHAAIIENIQVPIDGRVHMLVEPREFDDWISLGRASNMKLPENVLSVIQTQLLAGMKFIHSAGYTLDGNQNAVIIEGLQWSMQYGTTDHLHILIFPMRFTTQTLIGSRSQMNDMRMLPLQEKKVASAATLPVSTGKILPEYKLPEINQGNITKSFLENTIQRIHAETKVNEDFFNYIELLAALLSKGYETPLMKNLARQHSPGQPGSGGSMGQALIETFLQVLPEFGYMRTPISFYMTNLATVEYAERLLNHPEELYSYQQRYDRESLKGIQAVSSLGGNERTLPPVPFYRYLPRLPKYYWQPLLRSISGLEELDKHATASYWSIGEEELPLDAPSHNGNVLSMLLLHGVELPANDILSIFYNTPLATAVEFGTLEYDPLWLTGEDVLLIQDFLEGRLMPHTFYASLSRTAFDAMFARRSYLDLYELPIARIALNGAFVLGVPFVQQVTAAQEELLSVATREILHIGRLTEFVQRITRV